MALFTDVLTLEEANKIHAYVLEEAYRDSGLMDALVAAVAPHICIAPSWVVN